MNNTLKTIIFLMVFFSVTSFAYSSGYDELLENSMGKLLLLHDKKHSYQEDLNPLGSLDVYREFLKIYNTTVRSMPREYRIKYFWSSMWHLGFDGYCMGEFQELIMQDCGEEFIDKLQEYVSKEQKLKRYKFRLYLSEKVLEGLKMIRERK